MEQLTVATYNHKWQFGISRIKECKARGLTVESWCREQEINKLICGYNNMRKSVDGLASVVQQNLKLNSFSNSLILFCGRRCDRLKAMYWEEDGFLLLYKRLENGKFQRPRPELMSEKYHHRNSDDYWKGLQ